jgi:hypothetical protein
MLNDLVPLRLSRRQSAIIARRINPSRLADKTAAKSMSDMFIFVYRLVIYEKLTICSLIIKQDVSGKHYQ